MTTAVVEEENTGGINRNTLLLTAKPVSNLAMLQGWKATTKVWPEDWQAVRNGSDGDLDKNKYKGE